MLLTTAKRRKERKEELTSHAMKNGYEIMSFPFPSFICAFFCENGEVLFFFPFHNANFIFPTELICWWKT
jgi:hypothetical protein